MNYEYYKYLSSLSVNLEDLLLDPNNPRFAELGDNDMIPESRFDEPRIQSDAYEKMKSDRFNVSELRDTIKALGFLQMDRIVVRSWKCNTSEKTKYVVIEGNRRVTALKWLLDLHKTGKESFTDEQILNFSTLEVLLLDKGASELSSLILPGLRHVSGIKEWGPYQKARAVYMLREKDVSPQEAAQSLGLSTREANRLWRSYLALEQMKADEEFGEFAEPKMYSYFEEIFKKVEVRNWLDWDDGERRFRESRHLREIYSWMVGGYNDDGDVITRKLPEAKSIRELALIINDERALSVLRSENGSLSSARSRYDSDHPEEWTPVIITADDALKNMTVEQLKKLNQQQIDFLTELKKRIEDLLKDREKLVING